MDVNIHAFLTSALDLNEKPNSRYSRFIPSTGRIGVCVAPQSWHGRGGEDKRPYTCRESNLGYPARSRHPTD